MSKKSTDKQTKRCPICGRFVSDAVHASAEQMIKDVRELKSQVEALDQKKGMLLIELQSAEEKIRELEERNVAINVSNQDFVKQINEMTEKLMVAEEKVRRADMSFFRRIFRR